MFVFIDDPVGSYLKVVMYDDWHVMFISAFNSTVKSYWEIKRPSEILIHV